MIRQYNEYNVRNSDCSNTYFQRCKHHLFYTSMFVNVCLITHYYSQCSEA